MGHRRKGPRNIVSTGTRIQSGQVCNSAIRGRIGRNAVEDWTCSVGFYILRQAVVSHSEWFIDQSPWSHTIKYWLQSLLLVRYVSTARIRFDRRGRSLHAYRYESWKETNKIFHRIQLWYQQFSAWHVRFQGMQNNTTATWFNKIIAGRYATRAWWKLSLQCWRTKRRNRGQQEANDRIPRYYQKDTPYLTHVCYNSAPAGLNGGDQNSNFGHQSFNGTITNRKTH